MARVLFAWELGGDLGHARPSMRIGRELRALGHETAFAFSDLAALGEHARDGLEWFQAPLLPPAPGAGPSPLNASEILLHRGFGDAAALAGALRGWLGLFQLWGPDALVADYAPGALLAARLAGLESIAIGVGFSAPPSGDPMPGLRSWIATDEGALRQIDARLLAAVRGAFERVAPRSHPPASAAEIFAAGHHLLCTWPETDPFGPRAAMEYVGPQDDPGAGAPAAWRGSARPRVFAYLKPRDARFGPLLEALRAVAGEAIVAAPGMDPPSAAARSSSTLQVLAEAVAVGPLLAEADLCVCHGGQGLTAYALAAGVPLALLPQQLEQFLIARRIVSAGAGVMLSPDAGTVDFGKWLREALASGELRAAAAGSPVRGRVPASAAQRIAARVES